MVQKQTWIKRTAPDQPIGLVARKALQRRLKVVSDYLPLAAGKPGRDVEYVHQLRVATRRAVAAIRLFGEVLPKNRAARLKKQLRRIRRSAGKARDLDVLSARLRREADATGRTDGSLLIGQVQRERNKAQKPLRRAQGRLGRKGLRRKIRRLLKRIRWRGEGPEPTLAEAGRRHLSPIVADFFAAAHEPSDPQALHEMRVRGKRLRYAMELLAGAFDESFRTELYPVFADVQERLGKINDHLTAAGLFRQWLERADRTEGTRDDRSHSPLLTAMIQAELQELDVCCRQFREWWTAHRCRELQQQFEQLTGIST